MSGIEIARAIWRLAGSAVVAGAFLIFLAVASAQHEAVQALDATKSGLSYSVARDTLRNADADRSKQQQLRYRNEGLTSAGHALENDKSAFEAERYTRFQDVDLAAGAIVKSGQCDTLPPGIELPTVPDLALWKKVQVCAQQGTVPASVMKTVSELSAPNANPAVIQQRIDKLDRDIKDNAALVASNNVEIDRLSKSVSSADLVRNALQDVSIIEQNGIIGAFGLTGLPPRVLPIFLTFFAGMFGALLITLILVVYPNNSLNLTGSDSFWYRIGLGGLIAVAIYVVLGGGLAMIGSNDAVAIGDTNFMFFCAIGILAGMFSDRAAGFLSDSAGAFNSRTPPGPPGPAKRPARAPVGAPQSIRTAAGRGRAPDAQRSKGEGVDDEAGDENS